VSVAFDVYVPGRSWLHRLDARVKLVGVALLSLALVLADAAWVMALVVVVVHALALGAGVPGRRLLGVWRAIAPVLVLVVVLWPVFDRAGDPVLVEIGWFRVTGDALVRALAAAGRLAALSFLVYAWLATTGERDLIRAFVRLGLPHRWGVALAIGLRFIPTLAGIYVAVGDAQQARGHRLDGPPRARLRATVPVLVASLVTALRTAEQVARALDARAFGAPGRRTTLHDLRMGPGDWLAGVVVAVAAGLLLVVGG
jgi:energy-coupling factor transporter transmembrane protein EcfT